MPNPSRPFADPSVGAIDWENVEDRQAPSLRDALGLSPEDRRALGLTVPRTIDLVPEATGDATQALREAIARGAAYAKR